MNESKDGLAFEFSDKPIPESKFNDLNLIVELELEARKQVEILRNNSRLCNAFRLVEAALGNLGSTIYELRKARNAD